ncbi:hypothetical protein Chor_003424 [Crotalus horridus]
MLYSEDNTDNEQEDLPYDGDLQDRGQYSCDSENWKEFISVEHVSPTVSTLTSSPLSSLTKDNSNCKKQLSQRKINTVLLTKQNDIEFTMTTEKEIQVGGFTSSGRNEEFSNSKISDVLLRHFSTENLTCQLIDSETIPELSFTDSFDETVLKKDQISENTGIFSPKEEIKNSERKVNCNSGVKNWDLTHDKLPLTAKCAVVCNSKYCNMDNSQILIQKEPGINEDLNYTSTCKEYQNQQYFLDNAENNNNHPQCNEHQAHYRLCDSSEMSPKVRELKGNSESFVFKRTKSSTHLLGKDVLEAMTFLESDTIRNQGEENGTFNLDQQLEMLTRQAEIQNHTDHLRFSPKIPPCPNSHTAELSGQAQSTGIASKMPAFSPVTIPMEHMLGFSQSPHSANAVRKPSVNTPFLQNVTDDKEQILKKQTEELKANVEIFSECIKQNVFSVEEHLQFLQLLKEQLEQLEGYYVATKEKHYALQRQNHKHSSRNIGEFDPNRNLNDLQIRSSALANFMCKESNEVDFTLLNEQEIKQQNTEKEVEDILIVKDFRSSLKKNQKAFALVNLTILPLNLLEVQLNNIPYIIYNRLPLQILIGSCNPVEFVAVSRIMLYITIPNFLGSLQKNSIAQQRICKEEQREDFIDRLCDRQNLYIPQTCYSKMHDTIVLSPQYLSGSNINGKKSVSNRRKRQSKDINSMILNCSLDNAIQMANNLKTTTEHMMQAVSEDLANVKIQTLSSGIAHQY